MSWPRSVVFSSRDRPTTRHLRQAIILALPVSPMRVCFCVLDGSADTAAQLTYTLFSTMTEATTTLQIGNSTSWEQQAI